MRRSKKLIIAGVLAAVLLFGSLGGIALAGDNDEGNVGAESGSFLDKVCAIYAEKTGVTIDQSVLQESFTEAQREMQTEAMKNRLQSLVEQGQITQQQADDYLKWEFGFGGHHGFRGGGCFFPGKFGSPAPAE
jgi:hypothetical protein